MGSKVRRRVRVQSSRRRPIRRFAPRPSRRVEELESQVLLSTLPEFVYGLSV